MKKAVMTKWVRALRSGKYNQGYFQLKDKDDSFCCLGVLCDISKQGKWSKINNYLRHNGTLPKKVVEWAEMKEAQGRSEGRSALTILNDKSQWSFRKIASFIEKNYKRL